MVICRSATMYRIICLYVYKEYIIQERARLRLCWGHTDGPASKDVPESAIAEQPLGQNPENI